MQNPVEENFPPAAVLMASMHAWQSAYGRQLAHPELSTPGALKPRQACFGSSGMAAPPQTYAAA